MRTYTSKNEKSIGYSNVSSVSKQLMKLEDNRPNTSIQRKLQSLTSNVVSQNIVQRIADFRSANVVQLAYNWSNIGEDGVLIGDNEEPYVIKFGGYDDLAVPMDQLGAQFGFTATNARIVQQGDPLWETVLAAKDEAGGGWNRNNDAEPKSKALVLGRTELIEQY